MAQVSSMHARRAPEADPQLLGLEENVTQLAPCIA